ncbi:MAG: hypothetical protein ACXVB1_13960 [Pseudobdellovibrionaceae bacterium]
MRQLCDLNFEIRFEEGFSPAWIDQILEIHNKTEMKRNADHRQMISKAFKSSYTVAWSGQNT